MSTMPSTFAAADIVAACRANADASAQALSEALEGAFSLTVGEPAPLNAQEASEPYKGPGLAMIFKADGRGLVAVLPEAAGLLPEAYRSPKWPGASRLAALARKLSQHWFPTGVVPESHAAFPADDLAAAIAAARPAPDAEVAALTLTSRGRSGQMSLIWPVADPDALLAMAATTWSSRIADGAMGAGGKLSSLRGRDLSRLPGYARSLLRIRVPVSVQLAQKKELVQEVIELVPGSIIKFEKGCDELLHMVVGGQTIAEGEAVKIGDKFGFRVTSMLMPREHFIPVPKPRAG